MSDAGIASRLTGIFLPVTTPFDPVTGDVAPVSFRENLRRWVDQPIDGIVLFGSTGEGALLDEEEKSRLTAFAREVVPAGLPLIAGASADSTRATIRQACALARAGAEAVLVHPPPYFGPYLPASALADYFRAVADASPVPVLLYHIPKYTKVTLEAGLVAELLRHPNVAGLKDSSGDLKRLAEYTDACPRGARLFVGNGGLLYTALELGAAGGILAVAVFAPGKCADALEAFRAGETRKAGEIQETLTVLHREVVASYGAVGVKTALDLVGYTGGPPRAPLRSLGEKEQRQVARVMQEAGLV
ncbi:MAG: dihydrodipicolinate synthase family protein [Longimicrobiales bacterium]